MPSTVYKVEVNISRDQENSIAFSLIWLVDVHFGIYLTLLISDFRLIFLSFLVFILFSVHTLIGFDRIIYLLV